MKHLVNIYYMKSLPNGDVTLGTLTDYDSLDVYVHEDIDNAQGIPLIEHDDLTTFDAALSLAKTLCKEYDCNYHIITAD